MAMSFSDSFLIRNLLELKEEKGATSSSICKVRTRTLESELDEGSSFKSDRNKIITSPSDDDDNEKTPKRPRITFTKDQKFELESSFIGCHYPEKKEVHELANIIGIRPEKIQVWFQNRRARFRKREAPNPPPEHPRFYSSFPPTGGSFFYGGVFPPTPEQNMYHFPYVFNNIATTNKEDESISQSGQSTQKAGESTSPGQK